MVYSKIKKKLFLLFFLIISMFIMPTCYATVEQANIKKNFINIIENYKLIREYPIDAEYLDSVSCSTIIDTAFQVFENNDINAENYETMVCTWWYRYDSSIQAHKCSFYFLLSNNIFDGFTTQSQSLENTCPTATVTVNLLQSGAVVAATNFSAASGGNNMYFYGSSLNFFNLSEYLIERTTSLPTSNFPFYSGGGFNKETSFSSSIVESFNPTTLENNFILNKEFEVGHNWTYSYKYYYLENEQEVDITNYVSLNISNLYNKLNFTPYIRTSNFSNLPTDTIFYFNLTVTGKGNLSNYTYTIADDVEVFRTTSSNTPTPTPSGDSPSGGGNYTEQLNNIEQGIVDVNENLGQVNENLGEIKNEISSGDVAIISAIGKQNENYWGSSGDLSGDIFEQDISGDVAGIITSMSGDLSNSEIFSALNSAEQGFIEILQSNPGDFVVSWDPVILYEKTFIPSGEINFSAYCREIPILGQVKTYLNIILSALFSFAIIKQVYNLVLGALGIDDPNLYESSNDEHLGRNSDTSSGYTFMTKPSLARAIRHRDKISNKIYKRDLKRYREERRRRDS